MGGRAPSGRFRFQVQTELRKGKYMKKQLFSIAFGLTVMAAGLPAQSGTITKDGTITANGATQSFISQQADTLGTFVFVGGGGRGGQGVTGSPLSAREETRTVQTLGDGTQLETSEVTQFYRDSQGRTRTEQTLQGRTSIIVLDPVASVRLLMDPAAKSATRVTVVSMAARGVRGGAAGVAAPAGAYTIIQDEPNAVLLALKSASQQFKQEDLGLQMQNGVMAEGRRLSTTVPAGAIGNNRDIHVVNEQWYSKDLKMMEI